MDLKNTKPDCSQNGIGGMGSLEISPAASNYSDLPTSKVPPSIRRKSRSGFMAVVILLFIVAGLIFFVFRLAHKSRTDNNQLPISGTTPVADSFAVQGDSVVNPLQTTDSQTVTINGNLVVTGKLQLSNNTIANFSELFGNNVTLSPAANIAPQTGNIVISGAIIAGNFQGNGSGLSNLNATNITSGLVPNDRLDSSITRLGQSIPLSAIQPTILSTINNLANNGGNIDIVGSGDLTVTTNNGGKQIVLGLIGNISDKIDSVTAGTGLTGGGTAGDVTLDIDTSLVTIQGNAFNNANQLLKLNGAGELPVISGINLTNLNASNIVTGTLADARLSANVTLVGNTFNLPNKLVQLDGAGNLAALNGSALTQLNASNLASGIIADARLGANVALLNANQTFTGNVSFAQPLTANTIQATSAMSLGSADQSLTLQGDMTTSLTATGGAGVVKLAFVGVPVGNVTYNLDAATTPGTYTLCTTVGNCANSGGGVTTLGGTTGKLARFSGGQSIADSSITDTGSLVTINAQGVYRASGNSTAAFAVQNAAGSANILTVDTTNTRVAIGQPTAGYPLDVSGDINSTTGLRVAGNLVCDASGCAASGGSGFYIRNGVSQQASANFNVESANVGSVVGVLKGKAGQTADLLQLQNGAGTTVASADKDGNLNTTGQYRVNGSQISSTNLSNDANLAKLNANQTFIGSNSFNGQTNIQSATNSTSAFQIQNSAGTSNLLVADTTNTRLGIGKASPGYTLDVNGDVNIATGSSYRINGVAICGPTATCAPSSGSAGYIQNGLTTQTANFNIQSVSASSVGAVIQGASGQTANLQEWRNSAGATLSSIDGMGRLKMGTIYSNNALITLRSSSTNDGVPLEGSGVIRINRLSDDGGALSNSSGAIEYGNSAVRTYRSNNTFMINAYGGAEINNTAGDMSVEVLKIKGSAGQVADLLQARNSSAAVLARISSTGQIFQGANQVCDTSNNCGYSTGAQFANAILQGGNSFGAQMTIGTNDNQSLAFKTNNSTAMTILANGNVGIGTVSPAYKLVVDGGLANQNNAIMTVNGLLSARYLQAEVNGTNMLRGDYLIHTSGSTFGMSNQVSSGNITFQTNLGGMKDRMTIAGNGNVSIGTTSDLGQLAVVSSVATNVGLVVQGATSQSASLQEWKNSTGTTLVKVDNWGSIQGLATDGFISHNQIQARGAGQPYITLGNAGSGSSAYEWALTSNNRLFQLRGDHTNSGPTWPSLYLSVDSTSGTLTKYSTSTTAVSTIIQGMASQTGDLLQAQNSSGTVLASVSATGAMTLKNSTNSTTAFQVQNAAGTGILTVDTVNSRFGIGVASPSYTLDVASVVSATNTTGAKIILSNAATGSQTDYGLYVDNQHNSDNGTHYGVYAQSTSSTSTGAGIGVYGKGIAGQNAYGVYGEGNANGNANRTQYGVYGISGVAASTNSTTYGGYFTLQSAVTNNAYNASSAALVANVANGSTASDWILNLRNNNTNKFVVNGVGGTGINTSTFGTAELLAVNNAATMDNSATVLFSTSVTTNKALVIQGAAGQTADLLQAQDSTGTVLASISATGNLKVKNADIQGAYITFSNNIRGYNVSVLAAATSQTVSFTTAHPDANYAVFCTPNWNTTCYVSNKTTTGFTLNYGTAAPASQLVDWFVTR